MIACRKCGITFSLGYPACPRCGDPTPHEERRTYLAADAARRVEAGSRPGEVRDDLIAAGFADFEAEEIVRRSAAKFRSGERKAGLLRLGAGIGMTLLGGVAVVGAIFFRPGGKGTGYMFLCGGIVFSLGLLACVSGGIAVVTGRTPPLGPIPKIAEPTED